MGNEIEEEKKSVVPHLLVERMEDIFHMVLGVFLFEIAVAESIAMKAAALKK